MLNQVGVIRQGVIIKIYKTIIGWARVMTQLQRTIRKDRTRDTRSMTGGNDTKQQVTIIGWEETSALHKGTPGQWQATNRTPGATSTLGQLGL